MLQRKCLSRRQVCLEVLSMNNKERDREVFLRHCIALKFILQVYKNAIWTE